VYEALGPRVLSYLRRLVPYDEAEDVMQRVFFEVWRSRDRFNPDRSLEAWVFAIARKRAIDHLRRRRLPGRRPPSDGEARFTLPASVVGRYRVIDVSLEADDGDPTHSKRSLLRGRYA
jgi:RNA polymerase sigma factor (sigma-70 family)